jgi:hypothetical protein
MSHTKREPYRPDEGDLTPIGASWLHVGLWAVFGPGLCAVVPALVLGEKTPTPYFVAVIVWLVTLVLMVRRTKSWRRAKPARKTLAVEHVQKREETRIEALKAHTERVAKSDKERQFALWDKEERERKAMATLRDEYSRRPQRP